MALTKSEPSPREKPKIYSPYKWPSSNSIALEPGPQNLLTDLSAVSRNRQTRREFAPLPLESLGHLLWLAFRVHSTQPSILGFDQQFRPLPSAGAIHPIHLVIQREPGMVWEIYDPVHHTLIPLESSINLANSARIISENIIPSRNAILVGLLAEPNKSSAKYKNPESLIWRDAGIIIGYLSLIGEAIGINLCPLGTTGDDYLSPLGGPGIFFGAGLILIGGRSN